MLHTQSLASDFLYEVSDKLANAVTTSDLLDSMLTYFQTYEVSSALLSFIDNDATGQPEWVEAVASWTTGDAHAKEANGPRYNLPITMSSGMRLLPPNKPNVVQDVVADTNLDEATRATYLAMGFKATANLPLNLSGRWVGVVNISWASTHEFSSTEMRLYSAISQQLGWRVDSMRALAETRKQREQAEFLAKINSTLSQATDEQSILNAVALAAMRYGSRSTSLLYSSLDAHKVPIGADMVAVCAENGRPLPLESISVRHWLNHDYPLLGVIYQHPNKVLFIEDIGHDSVIDEATRAFLDITHTKALVLIPLYIDVGREWLGVIVLTWSKPTVFNNEVRGTFNSILPSVVTTIANRRLFLTEQVSRAENELVARIGEAVNASSSFEDIVMAVTSNRLHVYRTTLTIYEGYDIDTATYGEIVASFGTQSTVTQRISQFYFDKPRSREIWTVEEMSDRDRVDEQTAVALSEMGVHAYIAAPISLENRIIGNLSFLSDMPRHYTEQDRRLIADIARLVAGAVERSRLRLEVEAAQKRLEGLYQSSENNLKAIINNVPLILFATDRDGIITLMEGKALEMIGLQSGYSIGQSIFQLLREVPNAIQAVHSTLAGNTSTEILQFGALYFQAWYNPLRNADGQVIGVIGVSVDITERRTAELEREVSFKNEQAARREAQEAVRFKDLFLATMSHELRTPLNAMIGYQGLMLISGTLDQDNTHMAERSLANSQRLMGLINNILDISRMASGGLQIVPDAINIRQLAQNLDEDLRLQAQAKNLAFNITVNPAVPAQIIHDPERLTQIVLNLASNAIKFTEKGSVLVLFEAEAETLVIRVTDTGIGMPPSRQHVIFDEFVQLDNSSTRKHQGAGLGLSIVKRLLLLMKGTITVKSEVGHGSIFTAILPLNLDLSVAGNGGINAVANSPAV